MVQYLIDNPTATASEAYMQAYDTKTTNRRVIHNEASKTMSKPLVKLALDDYNDKAKSTVIEVMEYSKQLGKSGTGAGASYANTALQSANSIIDRVDGKAQGNLNVTSTSVEVKVDLSGVRIGTHYKQAD